MGILKSGKALLFAGCLLFGVSVLSAGTSTFAGTGAPDSGGSGFKGLTDPNIVVSNDFTEAGGELYWNDAMSSSRTLIIKTDNVDAGSFNVSGLTLYSFVGSGVTIGASSTVVFKDKDGSTLQTMSLNSDTVLTGSDTDLFSFFHNNNSTPVLNVATVDFNIVLSGTRDNGNNFSNLTFKDISYSNVVAPYTDPTIMSATYDASTGSLLVTGSNFESKTGAMNDVDVSAFTFKGRYGDTYTLTDSLDVEITSATAFTVTLSAIDKLNINGLLNENGTSSDITPEYNLAASDDWMANVTAGDSSDVLNPITVSNVTTPSVTSVTYDADMGVLVVSGTNFVAIQGSSNDVDISLLTITGEGGSTYTITSTTDVEVTSTTQFTITLSGTDKTSVDALLNKNGGVSGSGTLYNLALADNWMRGVSETPNIAANTYGLTVSNANAIPTISGAVSFQAVDDNSTIAPFSSVTLGDGDGDNISLAITLDDNAKGTLSTTSIPSDTLANVQTALRAIIFTPTQNRTPAGTTETTTFTLVAYDGINYSSSNYATTVVSRSINFAPVVEGTAITTATQDATYSYELNASDVDGDDLNWSVTSATSLPSWLTLVDEVKQSSASMSFTGILGNAAIRADTNFTGGMITKGFSVSANGSTYTTEMDMLVDSNLSNSFSGWLESKLTLLLPASSQYNVSISTGHIVTSSIDGSAMTTGIISITVADNSIAGEQIIFTSNGNELEDVLNIKSDTSMDEGSLDSVSSVLVKVLQGTPTNIDVGVHDVNLTVSDGNGGEATQNFQITVANVNDVPTSDNATFTIDEDTSKTFATNDFNFTDIDSIHGDALNSIYITSLPNAGTLTLNDASVTPNQEITDITNLRFTPEPNANGAPYATFGFKVNDGETNSTSAYAATMNVNAVADAPTVESIAITTATQDSVYSYGLAGNDVEGDSLTWSVTSGSPLPSWLTFGSTSTSITEFTDTIAGPGGIAVDNDGNIYIAELLGSSIYKITPSGEKITFATVNANAKYSLLVVESTLYISYYGLNKITKIDLNNPSAGETDFIASIINPTGMVVKDGYIYVAQYVPNKVSKINLSDSTVSDYVTGTVRPFSLGFASNGDLYIANYDDKYLSRYSNSVLTTNIQVFAEHPTSIKIDKNDNIYVGTYGLGVKKISSDLSTKTDISASGDVWGITFNSDEMLIWGVANENKVVKLETKTLLNGTPTNTEVGDHNISLTLSDSNGGSVDHNFTITVANVNDVPTSDNASFTIDEDNNKIFVANDFNFTDVDAGSSLNSIFITTLPNAGMLTLNEINVTLNQEITDIATLKFTPEPNANGMPYTTFGFKVNDGESNSTLAYTATINVNAVADTPRVESTAITTATQGSAYSYELNASDMDGDSLTWSETGGTTLPSWLSISPASQTAVISHTGDNITAPNPVKAGTITAGFKVQANGQTFITTQDMTIVEGDSTFSTWFNNSLYSMCEGGLYSAHINSPISMSDIYPETCPVVTFTANGSELSDVLNINSGDVFTNNSHLDSFTENNPLKLVGIPTNAEVGSHNISLTLSDLNGGSVDHNFTITVANVNDAPTSANASFTIDEDTSKTFVSNDFNFTDIDTGATFNSIFITTLASKGVLTLSDLNVTLNQEINSSAISNLKFTPVANANGTPYTTFGFKVNDGESNSTSAYTATINVNALDDKPTLEVIANQLSLEDASDLNITLVSNDIEGSPITYVVTSSNTNIATVAVVNGKLVVTQIADAYGLVNIEVNATANGLSIVRDFNLTVSNVNDAPTIDTAFNDLTILEDALSLNIDINVSDIDGEDLNLTVESNNTALLAVTQNYVNLLSQGDYQGNTLDFNLTTQENANGIAEITLTLDDGTTSSTQTFNVEVSAVNDVVTLNAAVEDIVIYKNFDDINITLNIVDPDDSNHIYEVLYDDTILDITTANNQLLISSISGISGSTDVNLTVSDSESNATLDFKIQILSLEDDDNIEEQGEVEQTDINGTQTLRIIVADDNLTVETVEHNDSTVSHKVVLAQKETSAISKLINAVVELIPNGVRTKYEQDINTLVEVIATVLGQAIHRLTVDGEVTEATFESAGASTVIDRDGNGEVTITSTLSTTDRNITIIANADGSSEQVVTQDANTTRTLSQLKGTQTLVKVNGDIETISGKYDDSNGYFIKIKSTLKADGSSEMKLIKVNQSDSADISDLTNAMLLPKGTKFEMFERDGMLYMKATMSLSKKIVVE